jgi:SAM-dependent methyltransferase
MSAMVRAEESTELERLGRLGWRRQPYAIGAAVTGSGARPVSVDYPTAGLAALGLDGGKGYWFEHRAAMVVDVLRAATSARAIWDVGAGTGAMASLLARAGFEVVAVEPLGPGAEAIAQRDDARVFCGSLEELELPDGALAVVGLFDVIEHLADPGSLLREVRRVVEPGGCAVVTVPAFGALWSSEDEVAGHHRRYTRRGLDACMRSSGFQVVSSQYLFATLLVPALFLRALPYRMGRRRRAEVVHANTAKQLRPDERVDAAMRRVLSWERMLSRKVRLPAGLSVLGVYRVPGPSRGGA